MHKSVLIASILLTSNIALAGALDNPLASTPDNQATESSIAKPDAAAGCKTDKGEDLCLMATTVAKLFQPKLPMKMNTSVTISKVTAEYKTVIIEQITEVPKEEEDKLTNIFGPGATPRVFKLLAYKYMCKGDVQSYIDKGMELRFDIVNKDLTPYTAFNVDCKQSSVTEEVKQLNARGTQAAQ